MSQAKEPRQLLHKALAAGWEYLGISGSGHHQIQWPATGGTCTFPTTATAHQLANTRADIERISGPLNPRGPGRSRAERNADADRRRMRERVESRIVRPVRAPPMPDWREQLAAKWPDAERETPDDGR